MSQNPEPGKGNFPAVETTPGFRPVCATVIYDTGGRNVRSCRWSPKTPFATEALADAALEAHFQQDHPFAPQPSGSVVPTGV